MLGSDPPGSHRCRVALTFCHVHLRGQKPPSAEYPAEIQTLGDHIRKHQLDLGLLQKQVAVQLGTDNTRVTQLGIGSHQPWILVFLSHQTVPGLPADSGHRDAGRRARGPPICSRLVAEGGRSGPWGRPRARWRSGSVGSGCPGEVRSGRSRMVGGAVPPTLSRRFVQLRPHFRRIQGAISTC